MSTIIDELIVRLGLDSKGLTSKSGSATKSLNELESAHKSTAASVDNLAASVGKFLALLGGTYALKAFVEDTIASSAALDRLSKNLRVSVEDLSAWGNTVEASGGSAKGLQGTMAMLSQQQTELSLTGQSSLIPYFSALNVAMANVDGTARPVNDILLDLSERFSHMDRTRANNIGKMLGIDQDTLNLLLQGRQAVELMIKEQKEHSAVSKAQAEESAKLQRSMILLKQSFTALGRNLLQEASPALEKFFALLQRFGNWLGDNKEFVKDVAVVFGAIAAGMALVAVASSPLTLTIASIVLLGVAIAALWNDYQVWKRGGDSLINWGNWKTEIDAAKAGITELKKIAVTAFDAIVTAAKVAQDAIHGNWGQLKTDLASGTVKMNKAMGLNVGPDEAHDQNAAKADKFVRGVKNWFSGTAKNVGSQSAGFEIPGTNTLPGAIAQVEGFNAQGAKPNRPQRNHNPGDIEYGDFAKAHGATGSDGRFAIFPDDSTGFAALNALLASEKYRKLTEAQAINRFAPPNENNSAGYAAQVGRMTGTNPATTTVGQALAGIPGASAPVAQAGSTPAASGSPGGSGGVSLSTGDIHIHTPATDGAAFSRDFMNGLKWQFAGQANSGLT